MRMKLRGGEVLQFEINTKALKSALSVISKGVSKKAIIPITEYILIEFKKRTLVVKSTDGGNFISYSIRGIEGTDGAAIVKADTFIKLVNKTTKDKLSVKLSDSCLEVQGNGKHKVEILNNEEFPNFFIQPGERVELDTKVLQSTLKVNKSAIAYELLMPCLRGYYMGERVITTDGIKMCASELNVYPEPFLLSQTMAELLHTLQDEKVAIYKDGNKLLFQTDTISILGPELAGIGEYPDLSTILNIEHDATFTINQKELQEALSRLSLFANPFDNNGIILTVTGDKLIIADIRGNSVEAVGLIEHTREHENDVSLAVNIELFQELIQVITTTEIKFEYAPNQPIILVNDKVTQIISIMNTGGE